VAARLASRRPPEGRSPDTVGLGGLAGAGASSACLVAAGLAAVGLAAVGLAAAGLVDVELVGVLVRLRLDAARSASLVAVGAEADGAEVVVRRTGLSSMRR
jgi:hypothetical protein